MNNDGRPDLIVQTGDSLTPTTISILLADASGNYTSSAQISTSSFLYPCKVADVNADKKPDILCASAPPKGGNATASIYLGNGDGTMQAPISIPLGYMGITGALLDFIAVADFNNDGHADAIVTTGPPGSSAAFSFMLLGDGTGHFTVKKLQGTFTRNPATVADVNGDGIPDLLMSPGPMVYLGQGDGTFSGELSYMLGQCIFADFEKIGRLSAACQAFNGSLKFLHLNADGSFNPASPVASVSFSSSAQFTYPLAAADLNGDGILDLLASSNDGIQVILGKPGLTFGTPVAYAAGTAQLGLAQDFIADLDGDGNPDVISAGPKAVYISYGSPSGSLNAPVLTQTGSGIFTSKAADFDGDKIPDVVAIGPAGINFLHGNGDGTFAKPVPVALPAGYTNLSNGQTTHDLFLGDFNGDGKEDFLVPIGILADNLLFLGDGAGGFGTGIVVPAATLPRAGRTGLPVVADLNGDGKDDVVLVQQTEIDSYLSNGDGTFSAVASTFGNATNQNTSLAIADFNGDGIPDATVFFADHAIVLSGKGDGSFAATATTLSVPSIDQITLGTNVIPILATGDFDADGKQDIALRGSYSNYTPDLYLGGSTVRYTDAVWVYYGNGDLSFSQPVSAGIFYDQYFANLTAAALHSGGASHLVLGGDVSTGYPIASPLAFISSHSDRTFAPAQYFLGGEGIDSVQFIDFNNDGYRDLFVSNGTWWSPATQGADSFAALLNQPIKVSETIVINPQPSVAGKPYDVTATLTPQQSQTNAISGVVSFAVDGTAVGSPSLDNNNAKQNVSINLTGGDHQITATWAGDDTFAPVSVTAVQQIMDFTLTADPSVTIQTGRSGTVGLHLKSIDGLSDTINLSCTGLPAYASCTFASAAPSLSSGQTIDTQLTIGTSSSTTQAQFAKSYVPLFAIVPACILLFRRRRIPFVMLIALAGAALIAASGCGGGGGSGGSGGGGMTPPPTTAAGTYQITITASGKTTQLQRSAVVAVTVTK